WHDEPRLQHPPAGSARADGSCTRLSALTGGLRVPSCKGPRGRRPGVKTVPDRGLTSAQTLQPLAQLRQKSPKATIVRGSHKAAIDGEETVWIHRWQPLFCSRSNDRCAMLDRNRAWKHDDRTIRLACECSDALFDFHIIAHADRRQLYSE